MDNFTPRPGDDTKPIEGEGGLSTYQLLEDAVKPGAKGQGIDLALLQSPLAAFLDDRGHVAIAPVDDTGQLDVPRLEEWASRRGSGQTHELTQLVLRAVTQRNVRRPR